MSETKRNGATAPDRDPVAELAKRTGMTAAEVAEAIDELLANDGRSAKYHALASALHPDAGANPNPLTRRSLEAHRLEILRETGAASVSIVVTY